MAIRDVGQKPSVGAGAAGAIPPSVEKGLGDAGLLKGGASAKDAATTLLANLRSAGVEVPQKGDLTSQLAGALKGFQGEAGLAKSGQLDQATVAALKNKGIVPNPEAQQTQQKGAPDAFEKGGASLLKQGEKQRAEVVQSQTPDTNFLDALLNKLGPGGPNEGTSASDVKGAAQTGEAQNQAVNEAKKGEGAQKKGSTTGAQKDIELPSNQQLDRGTSAGVKVARGLKTEQAKTEEKRRKDALAGHDPTEAGILDEEADEDALEGAGEDGKKKRGHGGEHDGGAEDGSESSGSEGGERDGAERDRGNASSGDEDHGDKRRGNAQIGEDVDGEGHYRIPSMSEQAVAALDKIVRDHQVENRATTYSWDVTFYRPGIYGPGQKAQEIVHLVVDKATAFDPVWTKAQANVAILVKRLDQDGEAPTLEDIIAALRQARARDGDESAAKLGKVTRPLGRA